MDVQGFNKQVFQHYINCHNFSYTETLLNTIETSNFRNVDGLPMAEKYI